MNETISNKINNILKSIDNRLLLLDTINTPYALFLALAPLLLLILFPTTWSGNEENYFQLAYRRVSPDEFSEFHSVFDHSNARFLAETLLGWLVQTAGYDRAHFIARIMITILYSLGLTIFFRGMGLSALMAAGVITIFYLSGQQLFGGEWIFVGVEAKTFAYAAVFCSLGFGFTGHWIAATIFAVIAAYFHFLVGGFWAVGLTLIAYFYTNSISTPIRIILSFSLLISPLLIIILLEQYGGQPVISTLRPAEIYAIRSPHHIAPFSSLDQFKGWVRGVVFAGSLTIFFVLVRKYAKDKKLVNISLILLAYLFLALIVSFFDRNTYYFSKFYLFRPSSLILLLTICTIFILLCEKMTSETRAIFRIGASVVILFLITIKTLSLANHYTKEKYPVIHPQLTSIIKANSNTNDIILLEPPFEAREINIGLHRHLPRPTLVSWKFVPTNPHDLIHWYNLIQLRNELFKEGCNKRFEYPIKLLLVLNNTTLDSLRECGDIIWENNNMALLKVAERWQKIN